jgi:hypothetical protein
MQVVNFCITLILAMGWRTRAGSEFPRPPKLYSNPGKPDNEPEDAMQVTLDLPEELAQYLGRDARSLSRAALEALVLEGVRSGQLSTARRVLGFRSRHQMDLFLKTHGLELPFTLEQVRRDSETALAFRK